MSQLLRDRTHKMVITQIDQVLSAYSRFSGQLETNGPQDNDSFHLEGIISLARSAIETVCPPGSALIKQMETMLSGPDNQYVKADRISAIAGTLKQQLLNGWLVQFEELIHGEMFTDFLDMAEHLLEEHYKDAAAVIAGGTLESHLRQLCLKHNVPILEEKNGKQVPKRAATLNDNLRSANIYDASQVKLISSFLDLRNNAAHGHYDEYNPDQVKTMILGVRSFQKTYTA